MEQKQFICKFWGMIEKEEKCVVLKVTPAQWEDTCPNGYLFVLGGELAIRVAKRYEVIEEKSSPNWKNWFEIIFSEDGSVLQVSSMYCRVRLNFPDPAKE